jgi:uncharacterized membrane protein YdfJ with MMPL/SSD domain
VAAVQARDPGLRIAEAGQASVDRATNNTVSRDFRRAEVTSIPITLVLLLAVFGALIAAGIPLLLAGTAVATAISLLAIPSRWLPIGSTTSSVVLLVGMAVGIDYSLFYLRREREERAEGRGGDAALRTAAATSGRAIVVSGLTVMISPVVQNLLAIQRAFPGGPAPAEVVVTGQDLSGSAVSRAVAQLRQRAAASTGLREPVTATLLARGQVLVVSVPLAGQGTDAESDRALATLRDQALPATLGKVSGIGYAVTGITAGNRDFAARLDGRAPLVFAFVLGLAFLLLMITFRSVTIPLMSIGLNLLSVGAAYGLLTLVFQDGDLHGLLGFSPYGAIVPWMPLFMFVILFGLSMDYHVFILSRISELRSRGTATLDAITGGISASGRGDQRGGDHGVGLLDLRHALGHRVQDVRHRHGRGGADRRDRGPRSADARGYDPARRAQLVPAPLAGPDDEPAAVAAAAAGK